uniref:Uncharacterized protein n=1 Tax=Cacopsylla melanoneura TaxID=428564 RepID=A0A8D8U634_9HEMI
MVINVIINIMYHVNPDLMVISYLQSFLWEDKISPNPAIKFKFQRVFPNYSLRQFMCRHCDVHTRFEHNKPRTKLILNFRMTVKYLHNYRINKTISTNNI